MENKHTPGPWEFDEKHSYTMPFISLFCADNKNPFHGSRGKMEKNANARLIAAAPELLEALKLMTDEDFPGLPLGEQSRRLDLADKAIEKATGE